MNPILSTLLASPALADASRRAMNELIPVVERSFRGMRAGKLVGLAGPTLLTSCFAAGVAVGWLTAPAKGSELRAQTKERLRDWARSAGERAQRGKEFVTGILSKGEGDKSSSEANGHTGESAASETRTQN